MVPRSCCNAVSFLPITKTSDEEHNDNLNFRPKKPTKNCFSIILFYERYYISVDDRKNIIIYIYILLYL